MLNCLATLLAAARDPFTGTNRVGGTRRAGYATTGTVAVV